LVIWSFFPGNLIIGKFRRATGKTLKTSVRLGLNNDFFLNKILIFIRVRINQIKFFNKILSPIISISSGVTPIEAYRNSAYQNFFRTAMPYLKFENLIKNTPLLSDFFENLIKNTPLSDFFSAVPKKKARYATVN